jgi:two-component system, NtrC family, response regulator AtoC
MRPRILVVDDEPSIRTVLKAHLSREGHDVSTASDGAEAVSALTGAPFDLVISDLKMPGMSGLELLAWCTREQPGLPVVLITAHGTVDTAVEALKLGAQDFITKPFDLDELKQSVDKALRVEQARRRSWLDAGLYNGDAGRFDLIGRTAAIRRVFGLVERVADSPSTVLLVGESGTGKELVARALHAESGRRASPFVPVNCGAIPEALFESELFGHEKGAFTGAASSKPGKFELADGGTLFLDEVGELGRDLQVKLLRALQERSIDRVGGTRPIKVDVRVVAATNVDLQARVASGHFRDDLYYRLAVVPIRLPPLRERREDIPLLVQHFVARFNERLGMNVTEVDDDVMDHLVQWGWPGNIRELENTIERGVLLAENGHLSRDILPSGAPVVPPPSEGVPLAEPGSIGLKEYVRVHTVRLERDLILRSLDHESGNVTRTARRLDISRKALQLKMKEYGLRDENPE